MTDEKRELSFMEYMQGAPKPGEEKPEQSFPSPEDVAGAASVAGNVEIEVNGADDPAEQVANPSDFIDDHIEESIDEEIAKAGDSIYSSPADYSEAASFSEQEASQYSVSQQGTSPYSDSEGETSPYSSSEQEASPYSSSDSWVYQTDTAPASPYTPPVSANDENRIGDYVYTTGSSGPGFGSGVNLSTGVGTNLGTGAGAGTGANLGTGAAATSSASFTNSAGGNTGSQDIKVFAPTIGSVSGYIGATSGETGSGYGSRSGNAGTSTASSGYGTGSTSAGTTSTAGTGYGAGSSAAAGSGYGAGSTSAAGSTASTGYSAGSSRFDDQRNARSNKKDKPGYVTRKGFIIALICGMLATSGLTIGLLSLAGAFDRNIVYEAPESSSTTASAPPVIQEEKESTSAPNQSLAEMTGSPLSVQEIISKNANAVVEIQTEAIKTDSWLQNYITQGAGSGVIISEDGYIMTCYHVIEDSRAITVKLKSGAEFSADVIGVDPLNDVAVLKIEASGLAFATYGDSENLSIGDLVVAIGNPLGELGGSASTGIISALDRDLTVDGKKMTLMQTDASINPGNSGGGLFDGYGNFIGLVVAKSSGSDIEGLGFAIPINTAASIANRLIESGVISGNALIGVNIVDLTDSTDAMQYGVRLTGIYITGVVSDEAKAAGFEDGDLIYYVGDYEIDSQAALSSALAMYEPGDTVTVTVIRNNRTVEIETVLIERE